MSYTIEQNILNQGSLAGKYALKDLSNTGKYSGFINKLPVRRNVAHEVDASGIHKVTVENGSIFSIPNGVTETDSSARDCIYTRISRDMELTIRFAGNSLGDATDASRFVFVLYDTENKCLIAARGNEDYPAADPAINGIITTLYKTVISYAYYTVKVNSVQCSLPIGYFDGAQEWHTFDAVGFLDSLVWVEEDVEAVFAEGRDFTSNYKSSRVSNPWLMFTKFTASDAKTIPARSKCLALLKSGKVRAVPACEDRDTKADILPEDEAGYYRVYDENTVYQKVSLNSAGLEKVTNVVKLCDFTFDASNRITGISNFNMYKPVTIAPVESKVNRLVADVDDLKNLIGNVSTNDLLNRNTGGVIYGKTEYVMDGQEGASELVNLTQLDSSLANYAALSGASFSGAVSVPTPDESEEGQVANVGWVKAQIKSTAIDKNDTLSGVINGKYTSNYINTTRFTQSNFTDMFNRMCPDLLQPTSLKVNAWYYCSTPGWVQWSSSEAIQRNALRLGANPSTYYLVAQVAAWSSHDSCASAGLVPVAAGQWIYNYKHSKSNSTPVAKFFPMQAYSSVITISALKKDTTYNVKYYEILAVDKTPVPIVPAT